MEHETPYKTVSTFCKEYNDSYFENYKIVIEGLLECLPKIEFKNKKSIIGLKNFLKDITIDFNKIKEDVNQFNYGLRTNFYDFFMSLWHTLDHFIRLTIKNFNFSSLNPYITSVKVYFNKNYKKNIIEILRLYHLYVDTGSSIFKLMEPVWILKARPVLGSSYVVFQPSTIREINLPERINQNPQRLLPIAEPIQSNRPNDYQRAVIHVVTNGERRTRITKKVKPKSKSKSKSKSRSRSNPIEVNLNAPNGLNLNAPNGLNLNAPNGLNLNAPNSPRGTRLNGPVTRSMTRESARARSRARNRALVRSIARRGQ